MRGVRRSMVLGVVAFGVTVGLVRPSRAAAEADADVDVDDPKMSRVYQAPPRPASPPPKAEPPKAAPPKAAPPKAAPPKVEPPKAEAAKVEPKPTKPEAKASPKPEPPKKDEPSKAEPPKAQPPKMAEKMAEKTAEKIAAPAPAPAPVTAAPVAPPPPSPPASDEGAKPKAPSVDVAARPNKARDEERPQDDRAWPYAPRLKLAYRRFPFARVGAAGSATAGASTSESFESVSVDLYPMSWYLRVGLSTQFGWESEKFDRSGDYFIAESASVGFQWPGRFTPFIEGLAGAGYMRRVMADWNLPTAYWQVGIDAGVEIYLANRAYVSVAVGYLHPGNLFVMQQSLMSVKTDSWSLKFGVGI